MALRICAAAGTGHFGLAIWPVANQLVDFYLAPRHLAMRHFSSFSNQHGLHAAWCDSEEVGRKVKKNHSLFVARSRLVESVAVSAILT
jgi:hypothetical protein